MTCLLSPDDNTPSISVLYGMILGNETAHLVHAPDMPTQLANSHRNPFFCHLCFECRNAQFRYHMSQPGNLHLLGALRNTRSIQYSSPFAKTPHSPLLQSFQIEDFLATPPLYLQELMQETLYSAGSPCSLLANTGLSPKTNSTISLSA